MAKAIAIHVYRKQPNPLGGVLRVAFFWSALVGAIGLSRVWFGGAWIIDLTALLLLVTGMIAIGMRLAGSTVTLSRDENAAWVDAGMPSDVKAWKDARNG